MIDYSALYEKLAGSPWEAWLESLPASVSDAFDPKRHGDIPRWLDALNRLPIVHPSSVDLSADAVRVGCKADISEEERRQLKALLDAFHPWRKGPFELFGIHIDTEWRSDWKWNRLRSAISPLRGRRVLDVGSGNGYYGWRVCGDGAELVIGIDPYMLYVMQHLAIRHFLGDHPAFVLPLAVEDLPPGLTGFDTVFSMGVLHHRRSPHEHLHRLRRLLADDGELVLETLVIEGEAGDVLEPADRYANMRNVWLIPSPATVVGWLEECGYRSIRLVDVSATTTAEQRSTDWMRFQSLPDFLDPTRPDRTVEGYPAPCRAIVTARK